MLKMKRLFIVPVAVAATLAGNAQVNAPSPQGYIERGTLMYSDQNYQGAIDQLTKAQSSTLTPSQREEARWFTAMSLLHSGDITEARRMLEDFAADYPTSAHRIDAAMAIADCDFYQGHYLEALDRYESVDPSALDLYAAEDYSYRTAYCMMMLHDYDKAMTGFRSLEGVKRYADASKFYQGYIYYASGDYAEAKRMLTSVDISAAPGNRASYYLAQIAYIERDYSRALSLARTHMDDIAEYRPELQRIAGESLYNLGEESQAIPYLQRYVSEVADPQLSTLYILGVSRYKEGDTEGAIKDLTPVTACNDAMGQSAYLYIGQCYLRQGNVNSALLALEKAYRMDYDRNVQETAFYNYAVARMEGGRTPFGSSVTMFEDFLRRYPDSRYAPEVQEYLVTGYMTDNNFEKALASINKIKRPSKAIQAAKQRVLYILGSRDLAAGRVNQALDRFKASKTLADNNRAIANECDLWIGDCYYRLGDYARASSSLNSYLKNCGATAANRPLAYYDLGYSRFAEKRYADARTDFERVVKTPGDLGDQLVADAYNRIGDCYYYSSDFGKAAANYDRAYDLNPSAGDYALFQKAMMRGLTRDHKAKLQLIDDMMARSPGSGLLPAALLEKAESYVALNRDAEAIDTYETLVKRYPSTSQGRNGYLQLAITLIGQGNKSQGINAYKTVIKDYPTSEEARVASDDLKRLLADEGRLNEYTKFIASVPNAPKLETSELDELTFNAAEKAYLNDHSKTDRLKDYVAQYSGGRFESQALGYLTEASAAEGNEADALRYASAIVERYPDSENAEDALAVKGNIEFNRGEGEKALSTFRSLEKRASASRNIHAARVGIMRVSRELGHYDDVIAEADRMLASTVIPAADKNEIIYSRAYAMSMTGKPAEAVKAWETLAKDTDDLYGAKSAFYLAQHYYDADQLKKARTSVEKLIDSNTPHNYWLARGYILLSDICRKQGETFEANEYLKSLKENYPGTESDIFMMIDERLK